MKIKTTTLDNKQGNEITLNKDIFEVAVRKDILHRVVQWQLSKRQTGFHKTKLKKEISATTRKPFKQKGTGRARQGDMFGPHHRGGYKAHGPQVRSHATQLPKQVRKLGLKCALSSKATEGKLIVVDSLDFKSGKTKDLTQKLGKLSIQSALFIDGSEVNDVFRKACNNLEKVNILPTQGANVYDILRHEHLVLTVDAVKQLEARLA